jgi:RecB family exonuclease
MRTGFCVGSVKIMSAPATEAALRPTVEELKQAIRDAQAGDVLAPVDVIVPNGVSGVTLRRAVAGRTGLANVRFSTLPQLAERLAARHLALAAGPLRRPLADGDRATAVQATLAAAPESRLVAAARKQAATAHLLEGVFAEFETAQVDPTVELAGLSAIGREVLALFADYRARMPHVLGRAELMTEAAAAIEAGSAPATKVVLLAHGAYGAAEQQLIDALAQASRLTVVVADITSENEPTVDRLVVAPDAEEEVRLVIRAVVEHLEQTGCRPERIGIAYTSSVPYARLLAEQLAVAQIPHHIARQRTLAQTIAGRTMAAALTLHTRGYPRGDVLRWMADAPVLDAERLAVLVARWERISRDAGVSRGLEVWRSRLNRYADDQRHQADEVPSDADDADGRQARYFARAAAAEALLAQVEQIAACSTKVLGASTWAEASAALTALLERVLGEAKHVNGWSARTQPDLAPEVAIEQQAYDTVMAGLADLQRFDAAARPCSAADIVAAVEEVLDASVPSGTTLGRGILTGSIGTFAGSDLDVLFVLGATEGALPARQREHAILRDADRALLSPELATVASRRADVRRAWDSALRGAQRVQLSYPRADSRAQRRQFASPWFLEHASRLAGRTVSAADVDAGRVTGEWFASCDSFDASLRHTQVYGSVHELDAAIAQRGHVDLLTADDLRLGRGLAAARSRANGSFDEWTGRTGTLSESLRARVDAGLSATSLETWSSCPSRHLYAKVLGIRPLEDRGNADTVDARDKGTLVHSVLEQLIGAHLPTESQLPMPADQPWSPVDLAKAAELLDAGAAELHSRGLTGRDVLWTAQLSALHRALVRALRSDNAQRLGRMSHPIAVESDFGRHGVAPLVIDLPTQGEVKFAGSIDRVDARLGGGLVVIDYKTGSGYGFAEIPRHDQNRPEADLVLGGRKLQLVLYALAARQLHAEPTTPVDSYFWFVETGELRGGPVTPAQEENLRTALDVAVGSIRAGVFPLNPGPETWRAATGTTFDNCVYCPFDLVCPTGRAEQWSHVRLDPAVRPYTDLVDPVEVGE